MRSLHCQPTSRAATPRFRRGRLCPGRRSWKVSVDAPQQRTDEWPILDPGTHHPAAGCNHDTADRSARCPAVRFRAGTCAAMKPKGAPFTDTYFWMAAKPGQGLFVEGVPAAPARRSLDLLWFNDGCHGPIVVVSRWDGHIPNPASEAS